MRRMVVVLLAAATLAACGSSSNNDPGDNGTASVTGSVAGQTLNAQEALSVPLSTTNCTRPFGGQANASGMLIWISNVTGTCDRESCSVKPNVLTLAIAVWNSVASGVPPALAPGVFTIAPGPTATSGASAEVFATDSLCNLITPSPSATGGTVTITAVNSTTAAGNFTLNMSDGATLTGTFGTINCDFNTALSCTETFGCGGVVQCL